MIEDRPIRRHRKLITAALVAFIGLPGITAQALEMPDAPDDVVGDFDDFKGDEQVQDEFTERSRQFGKNKAMPDPDSLFGESSDGDGYDVRSNKSGDTTRIEKDQIFPDSGSDDTMDNSEREDLWGEDEKIGRQADNVTQSLQGQDSWSGEAFRTLKKSNKQDRPDLRNDPVMGPSKKIVTDIFQKGGAFSACKEVETISGQKTQGSPNEVECIARGGKDACDYPERCSAEMNSPAAEGPPIPYKKRDAYWQQKYGTDDAEWQEAAYNIPGKTQSQTSSCGEGCTRITYTFASQDFDTGDPIYGMFLPTKIPHHSDVESIRVAETKLPALGFWEDNDTGRARARLAVKTSGPESSKGDLDTYSNISNGDNLEDHVVESSGRLWIYGQSWIPYGIIPDNDTGDNLSITFHVQYPNGGDPWEYPAECESDYKSALNDPQLDEPTYTCLEELPLDQNGCAVFNPGTKSQRRVCDLSRLPSQIDPGLPSQCRRVGIKYYTKEDPSICTNMDGSSGAVGKGPGGGSGSPMPDPKDFGDVPLKHQSLDACSQYREDNECAYVESECIDKNSGAENPKAACQLYKQTYECTSRTDVAPSGDYDCSEEVRCTDGSCIAVDHEKNDEFGRAAALLQAADYIGMDLKCDAETESQIREVDNGNRDIDNVDTSNCKAFSGESITCREVFFGMQNCCKQPSPASLTDYLTLANSARKIKNTIGADSIPYHGVWESAVNTVKSGAGQIIDKMPSQVTDAVGNITSYFSTSLDANTGSEPLRMIGMDQLKQKAMEKSAEFMANNFSPAVADAFFATTGKVAEEESQSAVTEEGGSFIAKEGGIELTGMAANVAMMVNIAMWIYTIYVITDLVVGLIWSCNDEEMDLAIKKDLKSTHKLGTYCTSMSVFGSCVGMEKTAYCAFNSPIARILQEQVRGQLGMGWGSKKDPNCRGITLEEIQQVDWDRVDLTEWLNILKNNGKLPSDDADAMDKFSMDTLTGEGSDLDFEVQGEEARNNTLERNRNRLNQSNSEESDAIGERRKETRRQLEAGIEGEGRPANAPEYPHTSGNNFTPGDGVDGAPETPEEKPSPNDGCPDNRQVFYPSNPDKPEARLKVPDGCGAISVRAKGGNSGDNRHSVTGETSNKTVSVKPDQTIIIDVGYGGGVTGEWHRGADGPGNPGQSPAEYFTTEMAPQTGYLLFYGRQGQKSTASVEVEDRPMNSQILSASGAEPNDNGYDVPESFKMYEYGDGGWVVVNWGDRSVQPPSGSSSTPKEADFTEAFTARPTGRVDEHMVHRTRDKR